MTISMSSIEGPSTDQWMHRLFLYTTIFIVLGGAQYFDEFLIASDVKMVRLNPFFPHFAQMTGPALLMVLLANVHTKYNSFQFTVLTQDIILSFAVGLIFFLEIFHAFLSGGPLDLEFAYDLFFLLLCYVTIRSFDFSENYVNYLLKSIIITAFTIALACSIAIIIDFAHTKHIFFEEHCRDVNIYNYFSSLCRPIPDFIFLVAHFAPFVIALVFWSIFRNERNWPFLTILIVLLLFIVGFSKARLPWMLTLFVIALAGLFAIHRSKGLKATAVAAMLCLVLVASSAFFFGGETLERLVSLNRGLDPTLELEIRDWDGAQLKQTGLMLRYELFMTGLWQFVEHPIFGRGIGTALGVQNYEEGIHGIPIIYAAGYGIFGLIALVALFFPRVEMNMPNDWLFMKVSLLVVVTAMACLLVHPPFWFAAVAVFLHMSHQASVKGS